MNINREQIVIPVCLLAVLVFGISGSAVTTYIPNLTDRCYRCLCLVATGCNLKNGCRTGHCGPFNISRIYWFDAGKVVLPEDDTERPSAWKDCARDYSCAKKIIEGYLKNYGKDCNDDGVTNCFDYMLVNSLGPNGCTDLYSETEYRRILTERYEDCLL